MTLSLLVIVYRCCLEAGHWFLVIGIYKGSARLRRGPCVCFCLDVKWHVKVNNLSKAQVNNDRRAQPQSERSSSWVMLNQQTVHLIVLLELIQAQ